MFSVLCAVSVLLGVHEQQVAERSFKARLERRLAALLEEGLQETSRRRWRRATAVGNNSLQVKHETYSKMIHFNMKVFHACEGSCDHLTDFFVNCLKTTLVVNRCFLNKLK